MTISRGVLQQTRSVSALQQRLIRSSSRHLLLVPTRQQATRNELESHRLSANREGKSAPKLSLPEIVQHQIDHRRLKGKS